MFRRRLPDQTERFASRAPVGLGRRRSDALHRPPVCGWARVAALGIALVVASGALADEQIGVRSLDEVMAGATAMTTIAGAYLFVSRPEGGYICGINLNDRFFSAIAQGALENAFAERPAAICVSARHVRDLTAPEDLLP